MKPDIHPAYVDTQVTCSCGNTFMTRSTAKNGTLHAEVCSACHPSTPESRRFWTPVAGLRRFERRFGKRTTTETAKADN